MRFIAAVCALPGMICSINAAEILPRMVTVQADRISLKQAMAKVTEQTGIEVVAEEAVGNPQFPLNIQKKPFWESMEIIAKAANARVYLYGGKNQIKLTTRQPGQDLRISTSGLFRTTLEQIVATRRFGTGTHGLTLSLETAWEPGFAPLFLQSYPNGFICSDENGRNYGALSPSSSWIDVYGQKTAGVRVSLTLPNKQQKRAIRLSTVQGKFQICGASRMIDFGFGSPARLAKDKRAVKRQRGDAFCEVRSFTIGRRVWTVQIKTGIPAGGPKLESNQFWFENNRLYLKDSQNRRVTSNPPNRDSIGARTALLTYTFENPRGLDPSRLSLFYQMPEALVTIPVPFQFKDIPLP